MVQQKLKYAENDQDECSTLSFLSAFEFNVG